MSDLIWEEPPAPAKPMSKLAPLLAAVRERPGEWARLPKVYSKHGTAASRASSLRKKNPGFEFLARRLPDSEDTSIWVRYVEKTYPTGGIT
jgi:hypothetical protein